jgi:tetratricopeptide (TPR) repeat protein
MKLKAILLTTLALGFASITPARAQEFQTKAEYDAYMALYNETATGTKVNFGEVFVAEYPESEAAPIAYQILVATHFSERNWRGVVDVTERFERAFPDSAQETQSFIYRRAMVAAQQTGDSEGIIRYGEHILDLDRNDLGALLTLPPVILDSLSEFSGGRERGLARSFELANRARLGAQTTYPRPSDDPQANTQRVQVFTSIHMSLGTVHFLREDYDRAVQEYETVLSFDAQHPLAYLQIGLARQFQAARSSRLLQEAAGDSLTEADDLPPEVAALEKEVIASTELAMDSLAKAVSLGGQGSDQARVELERLYQNKNEDSLEGLDEYIETKQAELSEAEVEEAQNQ